MSTNAVIVGHMAKRRDAYTEATIAALVAAARARFGVEDFAKVSLDAIAADAGVTTGAIYHHFAGKKGLFLAVAEQIEDGLLHRALAAAGDDPWASLKHAFEDLLDACAAAEVQRIIFLEAPRVIGPEAWREIELRYAYGALSSGLGGLIAAGAIRPYPVELIAPVLLTVLAEASRRVAAVPADRPAALDLMLRVLDSLRTDPPA